MKPTNLLGESGASVVVAESRFTRDSLHPAWRAFVRYCAELQHGEIEILKIQNGLPVLAELTRRKVSSNGFVLVEYSVLTILKAELLRQCGPENRAPDNV